MDKDKILNLVEQCIEKAANDFLAGKPVDSQALHAVMDGVRIVHHSISMEKRVISEPGPTVNKGKSAEIKQRDMADFTEGFINAKSLAQLVWCGYHVMMVLVKRMEFDKKFTFTLQHDPEVAAADFKFDYPSDI